MSSTPESGVVKSSEGVRVCTRVVGGMGDGGGGKSSLSSSGKSRSSEGLMCMPGKNWLVVDITPRLSKGRADDEMKKSSS